jgi:DNA-binding SARP family transcriptional activator
VTLACACAFFTASSSSLSFELAAEPFDETACRSLMHAHAAAGNRAEALRVYAKCRQLFRDELRSEPSTETAAVFLSILRSEQ